MRLRLKTFGRGGVHPDDKKSLAAERPICNSYFGQWAIIPMGQHLGAPAECLVQPGDTVAEGELIGRANGLISAHVHCPFPGVVEKIESLTLPNGSSSQAVYLKIEGSFESVEDERINDRWAGLSREELTGQIREAGLVGLGGAAFPVHVKIAVPKGKKAEYLIINGVECEPYLCADYRIMIEYTDKVLEGIDILAQITEADKVIIAVEANKPEAVRRLREAIVHSKRPYTVEILKVRYPQGDEKQLIQALIGREIPSGALPIDVGCVVCNVATAKSVFDAVVLKRPLTERIVTVSGGAVGEPANLKTRIGVPIRDLLTECQTDFSKVEKIVVGGPMMGFAVADWDTPVTKGTGGVLALTAKEVRNKPQTACLHCGSCVSVCPMGLPPAMMYKLIQAGEYEKAAAVGLPDCKECGCCAYACPAGIYLVQAFKKGKRMGRRK